MKNKILFLIIISFVLMACSNTNQQTEKTEKIPPKKQAKYSLIKGINLAEKGEYNKALEEFKKSYDIDPKEIITVRSIGLIYSKLGDYDAGIHYFEKALNLDNKDAATLYNMGIIYYQKKEYNKALEYFNEIKIEDIDDNIRKAKAYSYYHLKDYTNCSKEFKSIDFINKTYNIEFYNIYIDVLEKTNEKNEVYSLIYKVYEKNKEKTPFVIMFADYLQSIGAYDDAIDILKKYGIQYKFNKEIVLSMCKTALIEEKYDDLNTFLNLIPQENKFDRDVLNMRLNYYKVTDNKEEALKVEKILNKIKGTEENEKNMEKSDI